METHHDGDPKCGFIELYIVSGTPKPSPFFEVRFLGSATDAWLGPTGHVLLCSAYLISNRSFFEFLQLLAWLMRQKVRSARKVSRVSVLFGAGIFERVTVFWKGIETATDFSSECRCLYHGEARW